MKLTGNQHRLLAIAYAGRGKPVPLPLGFAGQHNPRAVASALRWLIKRGLVAEVVCEIGERFRVRSVCMQITEAGAELSEM
jgi:hypothetical protein